MERKLGAITKMDKPKNVKELQRFLGMVNHVSPFFSKCIRNNRTFKKFDKKNVPFIWADELIKKKLCEPPVLAIFDINKDIVLSVNLV